MVKERKTQTPGGGWARTLLRRAGVTQIELAEKWGCTESSLSRHLNSLISADIPLFRAAAFCELTGISLEELAARVGIDAGGREAELQPVEDPPVPTIRLRPDESRPNRWLLLAHVSVRTDTLGLITRALDAAAVDTRTLGRS
jgi:transcriptional regulator with XRE-family HTH domain